MSKEKVTGYEGWSNAIRELSEIPQAAANKAAEEGGPTDAELAQEVLLEDLEGIANYWDGTKVQAYQSREIDVGNWLRESFAALKFPAIAADRASRPQSYSYEQAHQYAKEAVAYDRASRQVANKAEVEPDYWRAKCEAMIDIWDDAQANPPDSRCYVENAWPEIIVEVRMALATPPATTGASTALAEMEARKDAAYYERNQVVAALAKCFPSGVARTAIEGWSEDWHGCVYIDLPTGQASWHFHDSQAHLFGGLSAYVGGWDGHSTDEKYARLAALKPVGASTVLTDERIENLWHEACLNHVDLDDSAIPEFARAIAREVAAQADQVAVPKCGLKNIEELGWAAPSPAKESK